MKKRIAILFSLFVFTFTCQSLFAQINLVNPVAGTWSNKQILVIDNTQAGDYYYSINGSDPERFGFAYDGPVLLDMSGDITLKVTFVARNGKKESTSVNYKVVENDAYAASYGVFISSFYDSGIINYSAGSVITIPDNLQYSLGLPPDLYITGQDLFLAENSVLTRCIPCVIWDKSADLKWRFVIQTFPQNAGIYSRRDVPFIITDWNTITFTDNNLIYKIDSEYWELPKKPKTIDRTKSHMISWQSIEFEVGNPVEFFVLPPKPDICTKTDENGGLTFYFDGDDSYAMSVLSTDGKQYQELFTELGADTFYGDKVSGVMEVGIFSNSVYQGEMELPYKVDKRPPASPMIVSNVQNFYSREPVQLHIQGEENSLVYVAVSNPLEIPESDKAYEENDEIFMNVKANDFRLIDGVQKDITLKANGTGAVFYKICAYSKNGENTSQVTEYKVLIDQYNYYFDASSKSEIADGTKQNPFKDFDKCLEVINLSNNASLKVKGNIVVPAGKHFLTSNVSFINNGNASLTFEPDSSIVAKNAGVEFADFRIQGKKSNSSTIIPLFKLENSVLTLTNCEAGIEFGKNGTFIDAYKSVANINNTIASITAVNYASFLSAVQSHISVKSSTLNAVSDTCVLFSCNQGDISAVSNSMKVSGNAGRIAELFSNEALFEKNLFNAQLTKSKKMSPIYADKTSSVVSHGNQNNGF